MFVEWEWATGHFDLFGECSQFDFGQRGLVLPNCDEQRAPERMASDCDLLDSYKGQRGGVL
jgi:hypothetical protein